MTLRDFMNLILNTETVDWNVISCWGASSGPSYFNSYTIWDIGNDNDQKIEIDSHSMVASLKNNLSISIAWGLNHNNDFKEEWANKFPDPKARSSFIDFFYNGVLIYRDLIVSVDGGRCYIPLPQMEFDKETEKLKRFYVSNEQYQFIKMLNLFTSTQDYKSYFDRTGIEIEETPWIR